MSTSTQSVTTVTPGERPGGGMAAVCREAGLSARQTEVWLLASAGLSEADISARLGITVSCIRAHVSNGRRRLLARMAEAAADQEAESAWAALVAQARALQL